MTELFSKYVIDAGPIIDLKHYYTSVFITLWKNLEGLIDRGTLISSTEVYRELEIRDDDAKSLAKRYKKIFLKPELAEQKYVREILTNHRELIKSKNIIRGLPVADPFVIAQAICNNASLITTEKFKPNAHSIPNICKEYGIRHMNLYDFFTEENWKF